jgi:hypothetical protein
MKRAKIALVCILIVARAAWGQPQDSPWATLAIDPLPSAYLREGCSFKCTIEAENGRPAINGPFEIRTPDGTLILAGRFARDRFEGGLKVYNLEGSIIALE